MKVHFTVPGVQLRGEVLKSSISDYFERMHRKEHLNPTSHWFTIGAGILFLLAGPVREIRTQDLSRALPCVAIGVGMALYGISHMRIRESRWRWPALMAELALWFGGVYWLVRTIF
jgi:hypothetical protein